MDTTELWTASAGLLTMWLAEPKIPPISVEWDANPAGDRAEYYDVFADGVFVWRTPLTWTTPLNLKPPVTVTVTASNGVAESAPGEPVTFGVVWLEVSTDLNHWQKVQAVWVGKRLPRRFWRISESN